MYPQRINPRKRIPFDLSEPGVQPDYSSIFNDAKDISDSSTFWAHTITFGYQPEGTVDGEPESEDRVLGGTAKYPNNSALGYSVVYVEIVRDNTFAGVVDGLVIPATYATWRNSYNNLLLGTVAHEIGHAPNKGSETADHNESGLMIKGGGSIAIPFSAATVKRFRTTTSWSN